jgi:hypothetical protein
VDHRSRTAHRTRDPRDIAEEVSERRSRSLEEPLDLRLRQREPYPLVEVRNPLHRTAYLVMFPAYPDRTPVLCTCTDFARRGLGTCKHIEAADRWIGSHSNATPSPEPKTPPSPASLWHEIDRRLAREPKVGRPASLRVREAGAALFESAG